MILKKGVLLCVVVLSACAVKGPDSKPPVPLPVQWSAPLPHGGKLADLAQWWQQWDDAVLTELLAVAQEHSATVAQAKSAIVQAQAAVVGAEAGLLPSLGATGSWTRSIATPRAAGFNLAQLQLQSTWEVDVFGQLAATRDARRAQLQSAELQWHDARVTLAATTAGQYLGWHLCREQWRLSEADAASRAQTARLTQLNATAGLQPFANAQLTLASSAQAANAVLIKRAECEGMLKSLVALSAMDEATLRVKLQAPVRSWREAMPEAALFKVSTVPADLLLQRPDLAAAQRDVVAASADVAQEQAARYPALSLSGFVGPARRSTSRTATSGPLWSVGPMSVSVPILDYGKIQANTAAAVAAYDAAVSKLRERARIAVSEVEQALVNLDAAKARTEPVQASAKGYRAALAATQARYQSGLASLQELEEVRRTALQAEQDELTLQSDRIDAWINLYRAVGGGWKPGGNRP